uniref:SFRICE_017687 n=1 Tax=Spodoptera frugiperda TaxID=7108 RepID=A0A2H1VMU7_SPOFR
MRFSILLATAFLLGFCMLTSGLVCMLRGLELYQKEEAHNAIIRFLLGCVLLLFGPVVIGLCIIALRIFYPHCPAVEEVLKCPRSPSTPKRGMKRPGASLRQRSQNGPSRQRRRYI